MKRLQISLIITLFVIPMGCTDFLVEELQGTYTSQNFYKTEAHAELAITGVYNIASFISTANSLWVFGDVASDDAVKGGSAGDQSDIQFLEEFNYSRENGYLEKIWKHYYEGITRANYLLYYGADIEMDLALKNRILAEAKFLRAYFYFSLVNIFGEIPIKVLPPLNTDLINIPKSSVASVYLQIEEDLLAAKEGLPKQYSGTGNIGRVTRGAAWGLLAKTRLYTEAWQASLVAIDSLEQLGLYQLQEVYSDNFTSSKQNNTESIFEIQHLSGQNPMLGSHLNQWFGSPENTGYFFNVPVQNFVDEFEVTVGGVSDPRLDYTVGRLGQPWINPGGFDPGWSPTGYLQKKHLQSFAEQPIIGDGGLNYVYLRYADILLMKAEALNELSRTSEAIVPLNAVRRRARESFLFDINLIGPVPDGLLPDVAAGSQSSIRTAIRHERRVELGFEFHRFFDLMRYGQLPAETALANTNFTYAENRYFLIPQSELDTNTAIDE
jgi:starch-binding outer membrane protein, SusD/RagB family